MAERDYDIEVGTTTTLDLFNKKLAEKGQEFAKKFKPFDEPCARLDFRDRLEVAERESERRFGFIKSILNVEIGDLDKYGNEDRFEFIEDKEETEFVIINGIRTSRPSGHTISYKCKLRGHGISIFVPMEDYDRMKKERK